MTKQLMVEQTNIFSELYPKFVIDKPIRLIELFAGVGSQAMALRNLGVPFEHWKVIEFDKFPLASYNAIHGTSFEPADITKVHAEDLQITDTDQYCYIMTYSFPCQDLSTAGLQKGMAKGSGTRSGLLWEVERILDECTELPQVLLMENVAAVIAEKNINDFYDWRYKLESLGYSSYAQILNAKDYGIPQNRARCFMVSILGEYSYEFPKKQALNLRMKDMLEPEVDEKYFLSDRLMKTVISSGTKGFYMKPEIDLDIARPIVATVVNMHRAGTDNYVSEQFASGGDKVSVKEFGYIEKGTGKHQSNTVYEADGLARTLQAGDWKAPLKVKLDE